jgi:hypothetical protein
LTRFRAFFAGELSFAPILELTEPILVKLCNVRGIRLEVHSLSVDQAKHQTLAEARAVIDFFYQPNQSFDLIAPDAMSTLRRPYRATRGFYGEGSSCSLR